MGKAQLNKALRIVLGYLQENLAKSVLATDFKLGNT